MAWDMVKMAVSRWAWHDGRGSRTPSSTGGPAPGIADVTACLYDCISHS